MLRTTKGERRLVERVPVLLSTDRVNLADVRPGAAARVLAVLELLGASVTTAERTVIEHYLDTLGTPAPAPGARGTLYRRCPLTEHSSPKTYVNRHANGGISVHCLGGHGGGGEQHWTEADLLRLARADGTEP